MMSQIFLSVGYLISINLRGVWLTWLQHLTHWICDWPIYVLFTEQVRKTILFFIWYLRLVHADKLLRNMASQVGSDGSSWCRVELLVQGNSFVQEAHFFQNNTDSLQFRRLSSIEYLFTVLSGIDWRSPVAFDQKPPLTSPVLLIWRFQLVTSAWLLI